MIPILYSTLLFVHIVSALLLFVVEGVSFFTLRELRAASSAEAARLALTRVQVVEKTGHLLPPLLLLSGLGLCALSWGFATPWVLLSLGGFVGIALLVRVVDFPRLERIKGLLLEGAAFAGSVRPAIHDSALWRSGRIRAGLLLWLVFLMTVKPALLLGLGVLLLTLSWALLLPLRRAAAPVSTV